LEIHRREWLYTDLVCDGGTALAKAHDEFLPD